MIVKLKESALWTLNIAMVLVKPISLKLKKFFSVLEKWEKT